MGLEALFDQQLDRKGVHLEDEEFDAVQDFLDRPSLRTCRKSLPKPWLENTHGNNRNEARRIAFGCGSPASASVVRAVARSDERLNNPTTKQNLRTETDPEVF